VAGSWKVEGGRVVIRPFERLPKGVREELDEEAERLTEFLR
jgi:hypothetical protein